MQSKEAISISSPEVEKMILGCMLNSQKDLLVAKSAITEYDFEDRNHRTIFRAIKETQLAKNSADLVLVGEQLKADGRFQDVGGYGFLTNLSQFASTGAHIEAYCEDLRRLSLKRTLLSVPGGLLDDIERGVDPFIALERLSTKIDNIKAEKPRADSLYSHLLTRTSEQEIAQEIKNISPGVRVGMKIGDVDLKIPGGAISIVALPTGHGKTLLLINMILNYLALNPDKKAYFFSFEESRAAIISLFLNTYIDLDLSKNNRESIKSYLRDGQPSYITKDNIENFELKKNEFFKTLIDSGRLNVSYCDYYAEELVEAIKFIKDNADVGLVGIDYMQLLKSINKKTIQRQEELKQICLMLKDCAVITGLPMILAAQFNRQVVNEATISPLAIGEAGDIERVANMIIGGWNRNYNGFTEEGNKGRDKKLIPQESAMYLEILKGRETGIGHSTLLDLNGNTGKLTHKAKKDAPSQDHPIKKKDSEKNLWD